MKLHSRVALVTNSSSEVFWTNPGMHTYDLMARIDQLWAIWLEAHPNPDDQDWFYGEPEVIPEAVSQRYEYEVLTEEQALKQKEHWIWCATGCMTRELFDMINNYGPDEMRRVMAEIESDFIISPATKQWERDANRKVRQLIKFLDKFISNFDSFKNEVSFWDVPAEFYEGFDRVELVRTFLFDYRHAVEKCDLKTNRTWWQYDSIKDDLEYAAAQVPGAIYVDAQYNAAPQEFTRWVRSLYGFVGGQLG